METENTHQETPGQPGVRPGQVWADNDQRATGRTVKVLEVVEGYAICVVLTNSDQRQRHLDDGTARRYGWSDTRGNHVRVAVKRLKPTSSGYRLVQDVEGGASE